MNEASYWSLNPFGHNTAMEGMSFQFLTQFPSLCVCIFPSGETIRIVIEEYVQHLSGYLLQLKFDPTLLFNAQFQYTNRIALEFSQLYHWHPLMPDSFLIDSDELSYTQFLFNTSVLTYYGVEKLVDAFSRQVAGQVTNLRQCKELLKKQKFCFLWL